MLDTIITELRDNVKWCQRHQLLWKGLLGSKKFCEIYIYSSQTVNSQPFAMSIYYDSNLKHLDFIHPKDFHNIITKSLLATPSPSLSSRILVRSWAWVTACTVTCSLKNTHAVGLATLNCPKVWMSVWTCLHIWCSAMHHPECSHFMPSV